MDDGQAAWRAAGAEALRRVRGGQAELPLPGGGSTGPRWARLAAWGADDLVLARLLEGHVDAVAVRAELGAPTVPPGVLQGVWAAEPPTARLRADRRGDGWRLSGTKGWCTGARTVGCALVTAWDGDAQRLFAVDPSHAGITVRPDSWQPVGMAASDTLVLDLHDVPAEPLGDPGDYVDRPGFWHGGIGVAAVWLGAARAVARPLAASARLRRDPHVLAARGAVDADLAAADALLAAAAQEVDADPGDVDAARLRALRVRAVAEAVVGRVLERAGRATGAGPLCTDGEHARRVADLSVYVRQHHGERDLAALGALLVEGS